MIVTRWLPLQQAAARLQSENIPEIRQGVLMPGLAHLPAGSMHTPGNVGISPGAAPVLAQGVCWPGGCMALYGSSGRVVRVVSPGARAWGSGSWGQVAQPCCQGYPARACRQDLAQRALPTSLGCQPNIVPRCGACLPASLSQSKSTIIKHEI